MKIKFVTEENDIFIYPYHQGRVDIDWCNKDNIIRKFYNSQSGGVTMALPYTVHTKFYEV